MIFIPPWKLLIKFCHDQHMVSFTTNVIKIPSDWDYSTRRDETGRDGTGRGGGKMMSHCAFTKGVTSSVMPER